MRRPSRRPENASPPAHSAPHLRRPTPPHAWKTYRTQRARELELWRDLSTDLSLACLISDSNFHGQHFAGSYRQYQSLRNQAQQLKVEILPRAKENLDLTVQGYKVGRFDFSRVLTARQLYFQSNLTYIDSLTEFRNTAIEIAGLQLTGGLNPAEAGTGRQESAPQPWRRTLFRLGPKA